MISFRQVLSWLALSLLLTGCAGPRITRMSDREVVPLERMIRDVQVAPVVIIGEVHDVEEHHDVQLDVIKALHREGVPLAIGLEMFMAKSQRELDHWVAGRLDVGTFRQIFRENWKETWGLYSDIFLYARDHHIPMVGLNIPKETMRKVYNGGFASLGEKEREGLPLDVACDAEDPYTGMIQKAYTGHIRDSAPFVWFCEAQMLWNKGMAVNIIEFLDKNRGRTMVVLAGGGHAMRQGIPAQLKKYGDYDSRIILPQNRGLFAAGMSELDGDYLVEE